MKIILITLYISNVVTAFVVPKITHTTTRTGTTTTTSTVLYGKPKFKGGFWDTIFQPIHGHGTGEKQLGKMYKEEQAVLKDRRKHYRKDQLKKKYSSTRSSSWLDEFFSHPLHGHGSGENDHDSMYKAQQQVLYERREYYGNKDMLRKKYKHVGEDHLHDIKVHTHDPALLNKKEDDAMYIDENGFEFPSFSQMFTNNKNKKLKP